MKGVLRFRAELVLIAVALGGLALASGCGSEKTLGANPEALVQEGWQLFMGGKYSQAVSKFNEAVNQDSNLADAYNGLGWSYARMGELGSALDNFTFVSSVLVSATRDTHAGAAITNLALKNYDDAAFRSSIAIEDYSGDYTFQYDPDVTTVTLRLVRAISYFHLGQYVSAYDDVKELGGPQDLSPSDPDWVAELLDALQDLRQQYGQGLLDS